MSVADRLRRLWTAEPTPYVRLWIRSINLVGLVVVGAVLFRVEPLLGSGQTGVFRRALYPLVPPAVTLGAAAATGRTRQVALSGGLLVGYAGLLAVVGTLPAALRVAPGYALAGLGLVGVCIAVGAWLGGRDRQKA